MVLRLLGDLLRRLGNEWQQREFVKLTKTSHLMALAKMLQPYQADVATEDATGLVHVAIHSAITQWSTMNPQPPRTQRP